jgi:3',5'-cyclic AMP phosphodiesterase CpdA
MRFIHISDSHISTPHFGKYGHLAYPNLVAVVAAINALPFAVDFVLHTGDVAENGTAEDYHLARQALLALRFPIYYANGNHDNAEQLQRHLVGIQTPHEHYDYTFEAAGVQIAVFDSSNRRDHGGTLTEAQLTNLHVICTAEGAPLIIVLHHPPLPLDAAWIDHGWADYHNMLLDCGEAFRAALAPARKRIRGVFFGHVHHVHQLWREGIFYCAAPSTFGQLASHPQQAVPQPTPEQPAAFNLVTVADDQVTVRQYAVPRP